MTFEISSINSYGFYLSIYAWHKEPQIYEGTTACNFKRMCSCPIVINI